MLDTVISCESRVAKVQGPARSGKTEVLVQRCARLISHGTAPDSILVEVSSAFAGQAFRKRLAVALKDAVLADAVRIATATDICVDVLATDEARTATGRTPRLLNNAEYKFFLEDMKTLGQSARRLRAMLEFFYAQWSKLEPEEKWLLDGEESNVRAYLDRLLRMRNAMLPEEVAFICAQYLQSSAGRQSCHTYDYVFCDDYQNISRSEQTCLCLFTAKQLMICGNPNETVGVRSRFPFAQGFTDFDKLRHGVEVFNLTQAYGTPAVIGFSNALCEHGDMSASLIATPAREGDGSLSSSSLSSASLSSIKWNTPEDEFDGITKYLRILLDAEEDLHESRTCIIVPNRRWARTMEKVLKQRGFHVSMVATNIGLNGDPREKDRCKALVAYTKLNLLADSTDLVAWRSWCGFNNYLTNSDAWMGLQEFASQKDISLLEALAEVADSNEPPFLRAEVLAKAWREGQEFIAKNTGRKGFALLRALGADKLSEFAGITQQIEGDESAARLYALEAQNVTDPLFPEDPHFLRVVLPENMCGIEADNIFVTGAIDGFIPSRNAYEVISTDSERENQLNKERRIFYTAVSKANKMLVFSSFTKSNLELAELTKMHVVRIKAEHGERIAILRPTSFFGEAGNAYPGTVGGQQVLAEHDLN